jgi:hypothetical protein
MVIDERLSPGGSADEAFGRLLLDSAQEDAITEPDVRAAWSRFAERVGAVAAVGGAAAGGAYPGSAVQRAAFRGVAAGGLLGGAIAVAWMGHRTLPKSSFTTLPAVATVKVEQVEPPPPLPPHAEPAEAFAASSRGLAPAHRAVPRPRPIVTLEKLPDRDPVASPAPVSAPPPKSFNSTLAAEVLALDRTRAALAGKDFAQALVDIDGYHRDFPRGQLAVDAEALAVEVLDAHGEHAEASRRAIQFISQHPNDPHAERLRRLIDP